MGQLLSSFFSKPWRETYSINWKRTGMYLKDQLRRHKNTRLNILLLGPTGSGKTTLINSVFSVLEGRIVDKASERCDNMPEVGTHYLDVLNTKVEDFRNIYIFDTMGFTSKSNDDSNTLGISLQDIRALFEGRVTNGHMFNVDTVKREPIAGNIPNCVIFVVSAEEMGDIETKQCLLNKLKSVNTMAQKGVAKIVVITKIDLVCDDTDQDIRNIYYSEKVHVLVKKVAGIFGVQENKIFPVVNFVRQVEVNVNMSVPILYALRFAVAFASDKNV